MEKISRLNPLLEILKSSPSRVNKILIQKERGPSKIGEIIQLAKLNNIPCVFVPRQKIESLTLHYQGLVAFLSPKEFSSLEEILAEAKRPFLVLLDEIKDPQNLGAIIRSAEGAGTDGIIDRKSVV